MDMLFAFLTREEALFLAGVNRYLHNLVMNADRECFAEPTPSYELAKTVRRITFICWRRPSEMSILWDFARMLHSLWEQEAIWIRASLGAWTDENTYTRMNILGWHHVIVRNNQAWFEAQERFEQRHAGSEFYMYTSTTVRNVMFALNVDGVQWRTVSVDVNGASSEVNIPVRWALQNNTSDFREVMQLLHQSVG